MTSRSVKVVFGIVALAIMFPFLILAAKPKKPFTVDIEKEGYQYHCLVGQYNTPSLEFTVMQGTNAWTNVVDYDWNFCFAKGQWATNMTSVTGTPSIVSSNGVVTFSITSTNTFRALIDRGYCVLLATNSTEYHSIGYGQITVQRSPEMFVP